MNVLPQSRLGPTLQRAIALWIGSSMALGLGCLPGLANEDTNFDHSGRSGSSFTGGATRNSELPDFSQTGQSGGDRDSGVTRSSGSSGECSSTEALTPLTPTSVDGGFTTQARPTVWFYNPYSLSDSSPVFFSLVDDENQVIHETQVPVTTPGIYSVEMPESKELEFDTTYEWYVQIYCNDPEQLEIPQYVSAWVERVAIAPPLTPEQQAQMSAVEQSRYYSEQLIWYDAIAALGEALQTPTSEGTSSLALETAWNELLSLPSVEREELTDAPFASCCEEPEG